MGVSTTHVERRGFAFWRMVLAALRVLKRVCCVSTHAADMHIDADAGGAGGGAGDSRVDMEPDWPSSLDQTSFGACFRYRASLQRKPVWRICSEVPVRLQGSCRQGLLGEFAVPEDALRRCSCLPSACMAICMHAADTANVLSACRDARPTEPALSTGAGPCASARSLAGRPWNLSCVLQNHDLKIVVA